MMRGGSVVDHAGCTLRVLLMADLKGVGACLAKITALVLD